MKFEHLALNIQDPAALASWYVKYLGMKIVTAQDKSPYGHFLSDDSGMMLEIYCNPKAEVPDYRKLHHLTFHLAFISGDPDGDRKRLEAAGAGFVEEIKTPDGSHIIMMRDPWGVAIQFCKRGTPLNRN
ncbi:MAG: VOC family protein [Bacteroidales bacterium]|nr:VOC family protein [Bacteroidales bacterium]